MNKRERLRNRCAVCSHWDRVYNTDSIDERIDALMKYSLCLIDREHSKIGGYNSCNYFKKDSWYESKLKEVEE